MDGAFRENTSSSQPPELQELEPTQSAGNAKLKRWRSLLFALRMIEVRLRFIVILVGAGLLVGYWGTLQNYWDHWTRPAASVANHSGDTEFYCPMCPSVVRSSLEPNGSIPKCPICGMPLSKRKKGEPMVLPPGVVGRVQLSPARVRLAGVATAAVSVRPLVREIQTVGNVTYDDSRRARIATRSGGYLEKLLVNKSFVEVCEGDALAEIYSPELYATVQELLVAKRASNKQLLQNGREKLKLLGVDSREIEQIIENDKADHHLVIRSPHHGFVIRKEVVEGERVEAGQTLFEVVDINQMWIEADVLEKDIADLHVGLAVEATVSAISDAKFPGKVATIYPELQTNTRTVGVRYEVDNSHHRLRAGMYATVRLQTPVNQSEPFRTILAASKRPVGDPAQQIAQQKICPVTGAKLGSMGEPVRVQVKDQDIYICCAGCRSALESQPEQYLSRIQLVTDEGVLAVPDLAVIDTGNQQVVYVEREPGVFEGVEVKLGPKSGGYFAVIDGLLPGDRVAAAGAFLVDAETRLNPAASAAYFGASGGPPGNQPSSAGEPSPPNPMRPAASEKEPSADDLKNITKLPEADQGLARSQRLCPVTNMPLGSMGVPPKILVNGEAVFLCCQGCAKRAQREADKTLEKVRQWRTAYAQKRQPQVQLR